MAQYINTWFNEDLRESQRKGVARLRTSSESSNISSSINERLYSIPASYTIQAGNSIALNISPASDLIITRVVTNSDFSIGIYGSHANGTADGIFTSINMNLCSIDQSPTEGQVYYAATPVGKRLDYGHGSLDTSIVACFGNEPCVVIQNDTLEADLVEIQVIFEEIGEREPLFGLTASTQLEPNTEMSAYG